MTGQITGTELPGRVEAVKDFQVDFSVTDDGIIHLDECLNLRLAVTIPKLIAADWPLVV